MGWGVGVKTAWNQPLKSSPALNPVQSLKWLRAMKDGHGWLMGAAFKVGTFYGEVTYMSMLTFQGRGQAKSQRAKTQLTKQGLRNPRRNQELVMEERTILRWKMNHSVNQTIKTMTPADNSKIHIDNICRNTFILEPEWTWWNEKLSGIYSELHIEEDIFSTGLSDEIC